MTARQKRILDLLRPYLSDIYRYVQRESVPLSHTLAVRVPRPFVAGQYLGLVAPFLVEVQKTSDGFLWRLHEPMLWYRKGWTQPKWRRLLEAA